MNTLLIIDGNAIMHRAFHAIPAFKTKKGFQTNIVYGFISMLKRTISEFTPTHIAVCFDTPKQTFREKMFKEYQAQRPKVPNEFISQIPYVKKALKAAKISCYEKDGYEADDIIGTISKKSKKENINVLILTGDKDILQLVDNLISVISPQKVLSSIKTMKTKDVKEKLGVSPVKIPDLKALMGDSSDNYFGAKGIGPKTAEKLIKQYGSIEEIYNNIENIDKKTKKILENYKESVFLGKKLAIILKDVNIKFNISNTKFEKFNPKLKDFLLDLEMYTLAKRVFDENKKKSIKEKEIKKDKQISLF